MQNAMRLCAPFASERQLRAAAVKLCAPLNRSSMRSGASSTSALAGLGIAETITSVQRVLKDAG